MVDYLFTRHCQDRGLETELKNPEWALALNMHTPRLSNGGILQGLQMSITKECFGVGPTAPVIPWDPTDILRNF